MIFWRKYFLFLFFIFPFSKVFAEKQAKVVLHFKNFDVLNFVKITDDKNKILYWDETQKQNALFEIELSSPQLLKLFVNDTMDFQAFWIEEGMNEANFTNNIHSYKFFDSKINDEFITIQRNIKWYEIQYQRQLVDARYLLKNSNLFADSLSKIRFKLQTTQTAYREAMLKELQKYPNTFIRLYFLNEYVNDFYLERNLVFRTFQLCDEQLKKYDLYQNIQKEIDQSNYQLKVNEEVPMLILKNNFGNYINIQEVMNNNKWTYIDVWASFCAPCRKANRSLVNIYNQYKEHINFISYSADSNEDSWKRAIVQDNLSWLQVCDLMGRKSPFLSLFNTYSYPTGVLINPEGKAFRINFPLEELEPILKENLKFEKE